MASLTLSPLVPQGTDSVHFVFGTAQFDLERGQSYDTTDASVISNASVHPWLVVNYDAEQAATVVAQPDLSDPHQNPAVDHLSAVASPEAVEAATQALATQQAAVAPALAGQAPAAPTQDPLPEPAQQAPAPQAAVPITTDPTPAEIAVAAAEAAND
jgi:hypothetical protein